LDLAARLQGCPPEIESAFLLRTGLASSIDVEMDPLDRGFLTHTADPSFAGFHSNLNLRVTGIGEEFAMLVNAEQCYTC